MIRMKRGIQWDRYQIMGHARPKLFFYFFTLMELYSDLNNIAVSKSQIFNKKKGVVISQLECKRQGCTVIDLVCSFFILFPYQGLGFFRVPTDKGFPCAISL